MVCRRWDVSSGQKENLMSQDGDELRPGAERFDKRSQVAAIVSNHVVEVIAAQCARRLSEKSARESPPGSHIVTPRESLTSSPPGSHIFTSHIKSILCLCTRLAFAGSRRPATVQNEGRVAQNVSF